MKGSESGVQEESGAALGQPLQYPSQPAVLQDSTALHNRYPQHKGTQD